jgi:hypothetical protein
VDVSLVNRNIDYVDTNPDNFVLFEDGIYAPIIPNKIKPLRFFYVNHLGLFNHMRDGDDDRLNENIIEFFDNVEINCQDKNLRENRLLILSKIKYLFNKVFDFSKIEINS